ncbi:PEP-CTERM sorting domain-containing protein [Azohydromonas caseinilytica]|uniref:PEP-CTERM sorting domain-containing protein n=1 Tax=Azohydromonas caseinilytica TaxID=2728836 RepID=A0A848FI75_9BURK|nr:PEP-CTERM sorting domain-containing protein [Azohydromonas caseinilytica]NML18575.1 PEP-CTERM sorting domain-containing protein [Azohydromonas caseinilytica]
MPRFRLLPGAAVAGACLMPLAAAAYDPAAQFSPTQNPSGPWTYGWSASLGGAFNTAQRHAPDAAGLDLWMGDVPSDDAPPGFFPLVGHNGTGRPLLSANTVYVLPGELLLHPGPGGEYAVLRFTADMAGSFALNGRFMSIDLYPGTTDVHVLVNGQPVFDGMVDTYRAGPSFRSRQALRAGDVVDFAVGFGNGSYYNDSTRLQANISPVPEPSTAALWVSGLALCAAVRGRRRRQQQAAGAAAMPA